MFLITGIFILISLELHFSNELGRKFCWFYVGPTAILQAYYTKWQAPVTLEQGSTHFTIYMFKWNVAGSWQIWKTFFSVKVILKLLQSNDHFFEKPLLCCTKLHLSASYSHQDPPTWTHAFLRPYLEEECTERLHHCGRTLMTWWSYSPGMRPVWAVPLNAKWRTFIWCKINK